MKKAMAVLGLGAAAVTMSVSGASAMEQVQTTADTNLDQDQGATSSKISNEETGSKPEENEANIGGLSKVKTSDGRNAWVSTDNKSDENKSNEEKTSELANNSQEEAKSNAQPEVTDKNADNQDNIEKENKSNDENSDKETSAEDRLSPEAKKDTKNNDKKGSSHTTADLRLRQSSSSMSGKLADLKAGTKVRVLESKNGWVKVETEDGLVGWLSGYYVKDGELVDNNTDKNAQQKTSKENKDEVVSDDKASEVKKDAKSKPASKGELKNTGALNVRKGPSTSNGVEAVIHSGQNFKVVDKDANGWLKVVLEDGTTGWVSGKYVHVTAESNQDKKENNIKRSNHGKVNSDVGLRLRSGAGTDSQVLGTLSNNSDVEILGEENGWYKVKLPNGKTGYVSSDYIKKEEKDSASNVKESSTRENTANAGKKILDVAESLLGTRYVWGGTTTAGFDCSGFTQYVYKHALGLDIPRISRDQARAGSAVSKGGMKPGDLLYFDTVGGGRVSHVGIYMGNGKFIHASGSASRPDRVKVSSLSEKWVNCLGARRFA